MKLYKPQVMLIVSSAVSIILASLSILFQVKHDGAPGIGTVIATFLYGFFAVSFLLLVVSFEISYLKEVKDNNNRLTNIEKLCLASRFSQWLLQRSCHI